MTESFNFSRVVRVLKPFHALLELLEVQPAQGFNQLARGGRTVEHIGELLWRLQLFDSLRKRPVVEVQGGFGDVTQGDFNATIAGLVPEAHATNSSSETIRKPFDFVPWNNDIRHAIRADLR